MRPCQSSSSPGPNNPTATHLGDVPSLLELLRSVDQVRSDHAARVESRSEEEPQQLPGPLPLLETWMGQHPRLATNYWPTVNPNPPARISVWTIVEAAIQLVNEMELAELVEADSVSPRSPASDDDHDPSRDEQTPPYQRNPPPRQ